MKVVILAGGFGTRISEESHLKPKPMIEIGGQPILWHIMKIYSHYGFNDFIICLGYRGFYIKEYFAHYFLHESDITFDFRSSNQQIIHSHKAEPWRVTLIDTGLNTATGGRVKRIQSYIGNETFLLTYGDGVSDINITDLVGFHRGHGYMATVSAVQPTGRYGALGLQSDGKISIFQEKPLGDGAWVNAGFMVLEPEFFNYIAGDETHLERTPLEQAASQGKLMAYKHYGFWQCMDTLRDRIQLEEYWASYKAPWKIWTNGTE
jgi:glucose-1-phosphate cytidylyltransferase